MNQINAQNTGLKFFSVNSRFIFYLLWICFLLPLNSWSQPAKLAIIIDDIGYNNKNGMAVANLPFKVTLAVLPFTPHGAKLAELAHNNGKEIMLHTPMSNERNIPLGPGALTNNISQNRLIDVLNKDLADIPHVQGVNNHMGSQLTQDAQVMGWLMNYLKLRQLYFIDSRTTAKTQALTQAQMHQLPSRKRDIFLDDRREISYIRKQLMLALAIAKTKGSAIAIGHPYPETIRILQETKEIAELQSINLVLVSEILTKPLVEGSEYCPIDTLYPPTPQFLQFNFFTENHVTK